MPRLSLVDQAFFLLETEQRPMNIGVLVLLKPPAGAGPRWADGLLRTMRKRPVGPPFSHRVVPGPLPGVLKLVEDATIDPGSRLHRHTVSRDTDLQGLLDRLCKLHVVRMPRDEPLWEQHVYTGLDGGRVALYFKTHHGLIDGIGFINALNTMLTTSPSQRLPRAIWEGLRHVEPAQRGPAANGLGGWLAAAGEARTIAADLVKLAWHQGLRDLGLGRGLATPFVSTPDILKAAPSPHRVMAHCVLPLARVRTLARRGDAKINDVVLTVLDMALQHYLEEHDTPPDRPLVADVPVALGDDGGAGNRITILQVPLGRPGATPAQRLAQIVHETRQVKQEVRTLAPGALALYSIVEHSIAGTIESLGLSRLPMLANTVVSNPAGLEQRVYFNGAEVELALPFAPVAHHQVLNITVTTYVDQLHVTFIALRDAIPDLPRLAEYAVSALPRLEKDLGVRPKVAKAKRTLRRGAAR
ncbi:MAG: DUF1298 domain-containing protein [Lysobacterales bacterium]|jgi:WS/DGAT/MGAT family acyltransferase|nr:MAG: DUF1298 domain-containing protein [Xanthomonadales bacterium]